MVFGHTERLSVYVLLFVDTPQSKAIKNYKEDNIILIIALTASNLQLGHDLRLTRVAKIEFAKTPKRRKIIPKNQCLSKTSQDCVMAGHIKSLRLISKKVFAQKVSISLPFFQKKRSCVECEQKIVQSLLEN